MIHQGNQFNGKFAALPKCVILNSHQSTRPCLQDSWIENTIKAVKYTSARNLVTLTSIGMNTWELLIHLVNISDGKQIIVLPKQPGEKEENFIQQIVEDFELDRARCDFFFFKSEQQNLRSSKYFWKERDKITIEMADSIFPISIRRNSSLQPLIDKAALNEVSVNNRFAVKYQKASDRCNYDFSHIEINPLLLENESSYFTHWVRSAHQPYPGETSFQYYQKIISSNRYPNSAVDTLIKILMEEKIRASDRFIKDGYQVVSFTELDVKESLKLMRWRKRYVYYNFEPYGIMIKKDYALSLGFRKVIYGRMENYSSIPEQDKPFFQNIGTQAEGWTPEQEWRFQDNLDLMTLSKDDIKIVVYKPEEVERISSITPYEVIPLSI